MTLDPQPTEIHHHEVVYAPDLRTIEVHRIYEQRKHSAADIRINALDLAIRAQGTTIRTKDDEVEEETTRLLLVAERFAAFIEDGAG